MTLREEIESMRAAPKSVKYTDLVRIVIAAGYTLTRSKGSHRMYTKANCPMINLQDDHGKAKAYQVRQVAVILDKQFPKEGK